jgi:hypothetical protein
MPQVHRFVIRHSDYVADNASLCNFEASCGQAYVWPQPIKEQVLSMRSDHHRPAVHNAVRIRAARKA